jgi:hypothetical protein
VIINSNIISKQFDIQRLRSAPKTGRMFRRLCANRYNAGRTGLQTGTCLSDPGEEENR